MNIREKILVIEDEKSIARFISTILTANGYEAMRAASGAEAMSMISSHCPDLVILDLGLPDMDGLDILRQLRSWSTLPVVVVSARSHEQDKVSALDLGADDYLTKPFGTDELLARVRTAIRHTRTATGNSEIAQQGTYTVGDLTIDYNKHQVLVRGENAKLTLSEFRIVALLGKHDPENHRFINADSYLSTGRGTVAQNMYAYADNSPVMNTDSCGNYTFYTVNEVSDVASLGEEKGVQMYSVTVKYTCEVINFNLPVKDAVLDGTATFVFGVKSDGVLIYDNKSQSDLALIADKSIGIAVAKSMYETATEQVPGALSERTIEGIARELRAHYRASRLVPIDKLLIADMGGLDESMPGYDYNAKMFEEPYKPINYFKTFIDMFF